MSFLHPELLLLGLPALVLWWRLRERPLVRGLRLLALLALLGAVAGAYLETHDPGGDVIVVVDRSRSQTAASQRSALELVGLVEEERGSGDRVGVVTFGSRAEVEQLPAADGRFAGFALDPGVDGTDVAAGLSAALELVPRGRGGRILLVTDGEENSGDALSVARRAFARGIPIDVRTTTRPPIADLSVDEVELPEEVAVGEPFQFAAWVRSERRVESDYELLRGEEVLARGRRVFEPGTNRLVFRDVLARPGVADYRVRLSGEEDRTPENDVGLGAVRVAGAAAILVLNEDGAEDTLVRTLRAAGLPVEVRTPETAALDRLSLEAWRAIVLQNVEASRIGARMSELERFVRRRGGGLLVTGGRASFGVGGYHKSPIDPILPVSMELRQEHRKLSIALSIVLDRSGSMAAPAGTMTKMDLANLGAAAAIELLSPMDSVGVIAVDSAPWVIQPLTSVEDRDALMSKVRSIRAGGGGIYVHTGIVAAARMLDDAPQQNRHITLFSDAQDSEEQGGVVALVEKLRGMGVTVSVIALGTETDVDAQFLRDVAEAGEGDVYFTRSAQELPRLFAQDTLKISRSTFIEEATPTALLPGAFGLGEIETTDFPTLAGYNLCYLRPGAVAAAVTTDEYKAPILAFSYQGLGRTAVYTGQVGGTFGAEVVAWPGFSSWFTTLARWLVGQEAPEDYFASVHREGTRAIVSVEVDEDAGGGLAADGLTAVVEAADGTEREVALERAAPGLYQASYEIAGEGIALGTVRLGDGRFLELPPIALPYSPEFEPSSDARRGERLARRLARESGGRAGASATGAFRDVARGRGWRSIWQELAISALVLVLLEIAVRRLGLLANLPSLARAWRRTPIGSLLERRRSPRRPEPAAGAPASAPTEPGPTAAPDPEPREPEEAPAAGGGLASALSRAREAARRETRR